MFAISGALAGLAGIAEVSGQIGQLQPSISPGYGFTAIIVAFLGRLQPVGILIAGLATLGLAVGMFMWNQRTAAPRVVRVACGDRV